MTSTVSWAEYKKPLGLSLGITALVWLLLFTIVIFDPKTHSTALLPNKRDDTGPPIQQACPPLCESSCSEQLAYCRGSRSSSLGLPKAKRLCMQDESLCQFKDALLDL